MYSIMKKILLSIAAFAVILGTTFIISCTSEDTTKPVITLKGNASVDVVLNSTYTDEGATATDDNDGDISSSIATTNNVNSNLKGTYTVTYTVSDAAGNSDTKTRTVNVKNSCENMAGDYDVVDLVAGTPYTYIDNIATSSSVNNRIYVQKFAAYVNAGVYFDVNGTNITVPQQTYNVGSPAADRTFSGNGTISGTTIVINYTEVTNGTTVTGIETYTKK